MTEFEQRLLAAIVNDLHQLQNDATGHRNHAVGFDRGNAVFARRIAVEESAVRLDLRRWLGHQPSGAESKAASRAYRAWEAAELVDRLNADGTSTRTTHLRILPAGEQLAAELSTKD